MDDAEGVDVGSLDTPALIQRFEHAAIRYGAAEADELSREMHRQDTVKYEVLREVQRRGPEVQAMFLRLLQHENAYVRAESAMAAIHFAPSAAVPVLVEIGRLRGPIGFYARKVLARYQSGADAGLAGPRPEAAGPDKHAADGTTDDHDPREGGMR